MCSHLTNINQNDASVLGDMDGLSPTGIDNDLRNIDNAFACGCDENCSYNNGLNRNGDGNSDSTSEHPESPHRHSSVDRVMGMLNDMGRTQRTRSLSDGGQQEGMCTAIRKICKYSYNA